MEMPSPFRHHSPQSIPNCLQTFSNKTSRLCYPRVRDNIVHSCLKTGLPGFIETPLPL
jgi:hypothetical protein